MRIYLRPKNLVLFLGLLCLSASSAAADEPAVPMFSEEIESVLAKKSADLDSLLKDPVVLESVRASNLTNKKRTSEEILSLDKKFRAMDASDPCIQGFMTNVCAQRLTLYQKEHPGYSEIFIVDAVGLNVGQTNKTSDYFQADEDWWVQTYQNGSGKIHHGDIEFDDSSQSQAISLYLPIMDEAPPKAIGVVKAVLDLSQIKEEI